MINYKRLTSVLFLCSLMILTLSCFGGKKKTTEKEQEVITKNGKDYVKVPNPLYAVWRGQPEYVYVPKSQYRPLLGERITGEDVRIQTQLLERKLARLERQLKSGSYTGGVGGIAIPANRIMKKRVVLLPIEDRVDSLSVGNNNFFQNSLSTILTKTKRAIVLGSTVLKTYENKKWWSEKTLDKNLLARAGSALGVQAFLKVKLNRLQVMPQLDANGENYKTRVSLSVTLFDGLSGMSIYTQTIDISPDEINSYQSPAQAKRAALQAAAQEITDAILPQLGKLEWFTHIVRVDKKMVFIQGGRDDGLYMGDLLNVYDKPGKEIFNQLTGEYLGREPGKFKGRLQIVEFFGVDAAIAKPILGETFKVGDFVKLAR